MPVHAYDGRPFVQAGEERRPRPEDDLGLADQAIQKLSPTRPDHDGIVVAGGGPRTLDLLRLATVRSDQVTVLAPALDAATRRYVERFAVLWRQRAAQPHDLAAASAVLVAIGDADAENALVRSARSQGIPVHVEGRPLVSDFTLIELLERRASSIAPD